MLIDCFAFLYNFLPNPNIESQIIQIIKKLIQKIIQNFCSLFFVKFALTTVINLSINNVGKIKDKAFLLRGFGSKKVSFL